MAAVAIYAGSFDPFTHGHFSVFYGALKLASKVIVAVGNNVSKKALFDVNERIDLIRESIAANLLSRKDDYEVWSFEGLLIDFCEEWQKNTQGDIIIVRGLRALTDLENELAIADANRRMEGHNAFQTVFIPTKASEAFISSSTVREIAKHTKDSFRLNPYVTRSVADRLMAKYHPVGDANS